MIIDACCICNILYYRICSAISCMCHFHGIISKLYTKILHQFWNGQFSKCSTNSFFICSQMENTWPLVTTALFTSFLDRSYISSETFQRNWTKSLGSSFPSNETSIVPHLQCFILASFWIHPTRHFLSLGPSMLSFFL